MNASMTMLLKQLLESPRTSSRLLVYDPFREPDREDLVKEVIGLANADVEGPRNILFGVNAGAIEGNGIVGISPSAMADLKQAHRLLSALIEPVLHLAFIFDRINGKLVGALEIDGCDFGPFYVGQDFSKELSRGQCWVRDGRQLRTADRSDLVQNKRPEKIEEPAKPAEKPSIAVGFNDQPDCQLIELPVPDTSNPPFAEEKPDAKKPSKFKQAIKDTVSTVTTQILRLGHASKPALAAGSDQGGIELQTEVDENAGKLLTDAQNHYYFEEKAVQLNVMVCNTGTESIKDVRLELGFPRVPDFDVADRLYISPFDKRSPAEIKNLGYPVVKHRDNAIFARRSFSLLAPDRPEQAFRCPLRLAVGPGMQGRKLAILYKLRGPNKEKLGSGRLKIKFRRASS